MSRLSRVELRNFRCHAAVDLPLAGTPWVVLSGPNGAGKTSIFEAIFLACRGRSFRSRTMADLVGPTAHEASVALSTADHPHHHLNAVLRNDGKSLTKLDEAVEPALSEIAAAIPVDYLDGEVHRLISGSPAERRRFVDWTLFHVEPLFLEVWRSWRRAHRQRNRLLRESCSPATLSPWTSAVARWGEALSALRADVLTKLNHHLRIGRGAEEEWMNITLDFCCGWHDQNLTLSLEKSKQRERLARRAVVGPQYDDWKATATNRPAGFLSRGQAKLVGLMLIRARADLLREAGRSAILLLDDFAADLDTRGARLACRLLDGSHNQIWLSTMDKGLEIPLREDMERFHVKPGQVRPFTFPLPAAPRSNQTV